MVTSHQTAHASFWMCYTVCCGGHSTLKLFQTLVYGDQSGDHQSWSEIPMKQWKISNEPSDKINSVCGNKVCRFCKCWSDLFWYPSKWCISTFGVAWDEKQSFKASICSRLAVLGSAQLGGAVPGGSWLQHLHLPLQSKPEQIQTSEGRWAFLSTQLSKNLQLLWFHRENWANDALCLAGC